MEVTQHYEALLADVYDWMQGGWEARRDANRAFFDAHGIEGPGLAVDLGAGTGFQTIPLAERGFEVLALDTSARMLKKLRAKTIDLSVRAVEADLRQLHEHVQGEPKLIVCMGDTLSHLPSIEDADALVDRCAELLPSGGRLVLQFRDLSTLPAGDARFLPIRSSPERIFTCFLETIDDTRVRVHDILHVLGADGFSQHVSSYDKIRLDGAWLDAAIARNALTTAHHDEQRGLLTRIARKR